MKALIVEDNKDSRNLLMKQLRAHGQEVIAATNGVEALEQALKQHPDIIISDVLMPVMDGFQFCRECKMDENLQDIPFIFYTATYVDEKDEELALALGADKFIRKPMEPDEFMSIISDIIKNAMAGKLVRRKPVAKEVGEVFKLYSEQLGYSKEEIVGKNFAGFLHPEDGERVLNTFMERVANPDLKPKLEFRLMAKDGQSMWYYTAPTSVIISGTLSGARVILATITERKQAEEALRQSEEKYSMLFDISADGIL